MNAIGCLPPTRGLVGIDVLLVEGRVIHLDDIATAEEGRQLLAVLDGEIARIEDQLSAADLRGGDPEWRRRAETAHKRKRRIRPRLQERIGTLRRAERDQAHAADTLAATSAKDGRRRTFILAAQQLLGHEVVTEVWARAAELKPDLFTNGVPEGRPA